MRKGLTIAGVILIILIVFCELLVPFAAKQYITMRLSQKTMTDAVNVSELDTSPSVRLLLGRIDKLQADIHQAKIGQVYLRELDIEGKNIQLSVPTLYEERHVVVEHADGITLKGVMDNDSLKAALESRVDKIEGLTVAIHPDGIVVMAQAKILGHASNVSMTGNVTVEDGALYFRMAQFNVDNPLFGQARISNFFGDVELASSDKLPLDMKFQSVQQQEGKVIITAGR